MRADSRFATAVHVLAVLAFKDGDPVSSEFLSASVNTNPVMIRRLLLALQAARLVETRKGPHAGSRLSRSAGRINLAEVYRGVCRSRLFGLPGRKPNDRCPVGHCIRGILEDVFESAEGALERELARTTLAGVLGKVKGPRPVSDGSAAFSPLPPRKVKGARRLRHFSRAGKARGYAGLERT